MSNAVIVVVDASPRWLYGNTLRNQDIGWEEKQMALIQERLHNLMSYADDHDILCLVVEYSHLDRVKLDDLTQSTIYLAGVYGDECVKAVCDQLREKGFNVKILWDACLWADQIARDGFAVAVDLFDGLKEYTDDDRYLWEGDAPYLNKFENDKDINYLQAG